MTRLTALAWLLRAVGVLLLLAVLAVPMPFEWMAALHRMLGLGDLPDVPILHYLARSTSLLYANWGILYVYLSFDVIGHRRLIRFLMLTKLAFAAGLLAIDVAAGMPWFWTVLEGPPIAVVALVILVLNKRGAQA